MNPDQKSPGSFTRNKNNNIGPTAAAHVHLSKKKKSQYENYLQFLNNCCKSTTLYDNHNIITIYFEGPGKYVIWEDLHWEICLFSFLLLQIHTSIVLARQGGVLFLYLILYIWYEYDTLYWRISFMNT